MKLATELAKKDTGKTLYILDEPTTGLHFEDIRTLMVVLNRLVDKGNTVIVIEHNLDVIKLADHIIDMGPEGGREGGTVVVTGTPEEVAKSGKGITAAFLQTELSRATECERAIRRQRCMERQNDEEAERDGTAEMYGTGERWGIK